MDWKQIVRGGFSNHVPDDDVIEELAQHAGALYEERLSRGDSLAEASDAVHRQIQVWCGEASELRRRARRLPAVDAPAAATSRLTGFIQDIRYALRLLRRRPGGAMLSIVTMSAAIALTTVLFSVVWGVLARPLPWPDADRLVRLTEKRQGSTRMVPDVITNGTFLAWTEAPASTIEALGGFAVGTATFAGSGDAERMKVAEVTAGLLPMLRARPAVGALFGEDPSDDRKILLSYGLWEQRYGRAADVLGRSVQVDGDTYTIAGVMPRDFYFPDRETRAWLPMRVTPVVSPGREGVSISIFGAIGRLKPGVTPRQAADEGTARARSAPDLGLAAMAMFGSRGPATVAAEPLAESMTRRVRPALLILLAAVGLLFAVATANVASIQLARAAARRREIAVRSALGAGALRLARQLFIENLLLGLFGGALGLLAAYWLHRMLPSLLPADFPRASDVALDLRVLGFAAGITTVASIAMGGLPALQARRVNLIETLSEDSLAAVGAGLNTKVARARTLIMAGQVAVAAVLLIGASLLVRSFVLLLKADRGYQTANVLTARVPMPAPAFSDERRAAVLAAVVDRLRHTPGVAAAALTTVLPLSGSEALLAFTMPPGGGTGDAVTVNAAVRTVSPDYFGVMGIRLVEGRLLTDGDTATSLPVVVVNRTFAKRYLGARPLERRLPIGFDRARAEWQVAGIVEDVRMGEVTDAPQSEIYVSFAQRAGLPSTVPALAVKTAGDPAAFIPVLRALVREQDPFLALDRIETMRQRLFGRLAEPRLYAMLLGAFAVFSLVIASVGLFGVLSYSVGQRSREIALRSALGARRADIARLVLRQGLGIAVCGLAAGVLASFVLTRSMQSFIFGISPHDPLTFVAVPIVLLMVAAIACLVPVRRALALDPVCALKTGR